MRHILNLLQSKSGSCIANGKQGIYICDIEANNVVMIEFFVFYLKLELKFESRSVFLDDFSLKYFYQQFLYCSEIRKAMPTYLL